MQPRRRFIQQQMIGVCVECKISEDSACWSRPSAALVQTLRYRPAYGAALVARERRRERAEPLLAALRPVELLGVHRHRMPVYKTWALFVFTFVNK